MRVLSSRWKELVAADVDGILFCNEGDRPYSLKGSFEGAAILARVVTELAPRDRPFGVDFLWDARVALAVAVATGADFIREVTTGVYESDMGLWNTDAAGSLREREFVSTLGRRSVGDVARSAVVSSLADAVLVSGPPWVQKEIQNPRFVGTVENKRPRSAGPFQ